VQECAIAEKFRGVPGLVQLLDVFVARDRWHLVYEHHGAALNQVLKAQTLTPVQATTVLRDVLQGLRALHAAGLIHADLKPPNIFVDTRGHTWVTVVGDLGSAQEALIFGRRRVTHLSFLRRSIDVDSYRVSFERSSNI